MPKDEKEAALWYRGAAEQDLPSAQRVIAIMYGEGVGVEKNKEEAENSLQRAGQVKP